MLVARMRCRPRTLVRFQLIWLVVSTSACTSHRGWPCFQDDLTIKQGVYGFLANCILGGACTNQPRPIVGTEVEIYATPAPGQTVPYGTPIATTSTDADGFFEIAAAPALYDLCWLSRVCIEITVPDQSVVRFDIIEADLVADQWQQTECESEQIARSP